MKLDAVTISTLAQPELSTPRGFATPGLTVADKSPNGNETITEMALGSGGRWDAKTSGPVSKCLAQSSRGCS